MTFKIYDVFMINVTMKRQVVKIYWLQLRCAKRKDH